MTHYKDLPMAVDIVHYAPFYQNIVKKICERKGLKKRVTVMELGVRYACSSRIILEAFPKDQNFRLYLVDPVTNAYLEEIVDRVRVEYWKGFAEDFVDNVKDNSLDIIHVDMDPHGYDQTKNVFNLYKNKLRASGAFIFHDAGPHFGVEQAVKDIEALDGWLVEWCAPHSESPISKPAVAWKGSV